MKIYYWTIRFFSILFVVFISLFALDSLGNILGFLIHLIPSFILLTLTIVSWKYSWHGGILFILIALFSLFFFHFESLIISISIFFIGFLFFIEKYLFKNLTNQKKYEKRKRD
jgi:hypothetical protein